MASIKATLYTSKQLKDNKHPIYLQVYKNRKRGTFFTGFYSFKSQWNFEKNLPRKNHPHCDTLRAYIQNKIWAAERIMLNFDQEGFQLQSHSHSHNHCHNPLLYWELFWKTFYPIYCLEVKY